MTVNQHPNPASDRQVKTSHFERGRIRRTALLAAQPRKGADDGECSQRGACRVDTFVICARLVAAAGAESGFEVEFVGGEAAPSVAADEAERGHAGSGDPRTTSALSRFNFRVAELVRVRRFAANTRFARSLTTSATPILSVDQAVVAANDPWAKKVRRASGAPPAIA